VRNDSAGIELKAEMAGCTLVGREERSLQEGKYLSECNVAAVMLSRKGAKPRKKHENQCLSFSIMSSDVNNQDLHSDPASVFMPSFSSGKSMKNGIIFLYCSATRSAYIIPAEG